LSFLSSSEFHQFQRKRRRKKERRKERKKDKAHMGSCEVEIEPKPPEPL
jgi:CelD/BcsL family acetyltransferase involved in cellulose biosynthesis